VIDFDEGSHWDRRRAVALIGPGGAGKSSLGRALAPMLNQRLIDLDRAFGYRVGEIGRFIENEGYEAYKTCNSALAAQIMSEIVDPAVFVTSSGFLTSDNPAPALAANRALVQNCFSICLLPSRDLGLALGIVVERQLGRPFARNRADEECTIRRRYPEYAQLGDLRVFSTSSPKKTAEAVALRLLREP
jgi:shikimate kinase